MTSKKEEAAHLAAAALDPNPGGRAERRATRVAMHAVTDFTGELTRTEEELKDVRERLALYEGSLPTRKLDPRLVKPSKYANRNVSSFEGHAFEAHKQEIASAGGNVQPIKVRPAGQGAYEIVYGHRRHRACLDLGLAVLATIQEGMTDKELFDEMSRENEQRKDLSPYERAMHYKCGIDLKLYKNWAEIAAVLGKSRGLISRYTALAELPMAIVEAFPSPNEIQPKWAQQLAQVLDADAEAILSAAKAVKGGGLKAKEVFEALINQPGRKFTRVNFAFGAWKEGAQKVEIEIDKSRLSDSQLAALKTYLVSLDQ